MSIQNSINSAIGSVAGAVVAGKHMMNKQAAKKEAAEEDLSFATAELAGAQATAGDISNQLSDATNVLAEAEGENLIWQNQKPHRGLTKDALSQKQQQTLDDLTAAQRAFDTLKMKDIAAKAMEARWKARVTNAQNTLKKLGGNK